MRHWFTHSLATIAVLAMLIPSTNAQTPNLVDNPSFENYITCPNGLSDIFEAYWRLPLLHSGSSDYFNACAVVGACDVPNNTFGISFAASGDAYVGGYISLSSGSTYREYICDTLTQPLVAGSQYVVSFQYKVSSNSQRASDDMGFYLSAAIPAFAGTGWLGPTVIPTSHNPAGNYLTNSTWETYSDTITAVGGEQFITIGAFNQFPASILNNPSAGIGGSYMYWDDVDVHLLEGIAGDTFVCLGDTAQIYAIELNNVSWRDSLTPNTVFSTNDTIYVAPNQTTTYMCVSDNDTNYWTVYVVDPISNFVGNDTVICNGETVIRSVDLPGYDLLWSDNETDSLFITNNDGLHWLEATIHGCTSSDTFEIIYEAFPDYGLGPNISICWYDSTTLNPNVTANSQAGIENVTYVWSTGSTNDTIVVNASGTYWVDITNEFCTMRDSIDVSHHPVVTVDLGPDMEFCYSPSEPIVPAAQNASTYSWSTGASGNQINVSNSGIYYVTATGNGCVARDSVEYTFYHDPFFDLPETIMYCPDEVATISTGLDPQSHSFLWNIGQTTPTIDISGGSQGNFWVQVTDGNCTMRDTVFVGMYEPINLELGDDVPACEGGSETIGQNLDPSFTYLWNTGATSTHIEVTNSGVYTLTVSSEHCSETDKVRVIFFEYPEVDLGNDTILCEAAELKFDVTTEWEAIRFNWYDQTTTPKHVMYADRPMTIWVRATNEVCSTTDSLVIDMKNPPAITLQNDTILCDEAYAKIRVKGAESNQYIWSNGDTSQVMSVNKGGTYFVTADDGICTSIDSVLVIEEKTPEVSILGPEYICIGEYDVLDATTAGAYYYKWNDGSNDSTLLIYEPGNYTVEVHHPCGIAKGSTIVEDCECFVRFPSAFKPIPSGINQTFGPEINCQLTKYVLRIYNRWGELIFESNDPDIRWDGKMDGRLVQSDAYGWTCTYDAIYDGERVSRFDQGTVLVIR